MLDRFRTFRNIFLEKMWFCPLFSKYDICKRSLNSLNYYYLTLLSRISTRFILYAFCHIFIHTYEIKRNFCEKRYFFIVLPPLVFNIDLAKMWPFPTFTKYNLSNDIKFSRVLDRCIKILQMCEKSLYYNIFFIY